MKRVASVVWQFFDRVEENKRCVAVICQLCDSEYKFFGNTTNLRLHLMKKHPIQWKLRNQIQKPSGVADLSKIDDDDDDSPLIAAKRRRNSVDEQSEATEHLHTLGIEEEWLEEETLHQNPKIVVKRERESPQRTRSVYVQGTSRNKKMDMSIPLESPMQQAHDEYTVFGEYVASKLRKIRTPRTRGNIQQIITTILWQADYGMYDSPEAVKKVIMCNLDSPKPSTSNAPCEQQDYNASASDSEPNAAQEHNVIQVETAAGNLSVPLL